MTIRRRRQDAVCERRARSCTVAHLDSGDGSEVSDEFDRIGSVDAMFNAISSLDVVVRPGETALEWPPNHEPICHTDALVAGTHFPAEAPADLIGYRSMVVTMSGLAAMGAAAVSARVSLATPTLSRVWAAQFAGGITRAALDFGLKIVTGDLERGPQTVRVTVHGRVPTGTAIPRSGAKAGDSVYVSGVLGAASLALLGAELAVPPRAALKADTPLRRYWKPTPRVQLGVGLRMLATAAIAVSDGLTADLAHLCKASGVCCDVYLERVPVCQGTTALEAVGASDDYELAFTAPAAAEERLHMLRQQVDVPISRIGIVQANAPGTVRLFDQGVVV